MSSTTVVSGSQISTGLTVGVNSTVIALSGGYVSNATVLKGGTLIVSNGGTQSGSVISSGGLEIVQASGAVASAYGGALESGGTAIIRNSGTVNATNIYGTLIVSSGGFPENVVIDAGATVTLMSGALGDAIEVTNGASVVVVSGATLGSSVADTNNTIAAAISSGGTMTVLSGGIVTNLHVSNGGTLNLEAGVSANNVYVGQGASTSAPGVINLFGATMTLSSGAVSGADGYGIINFNSTANGVVSQTDTLANGGTALNNDVVSGFLSSTDTIDLGVASAAGASGVVRSGGTAVITDGANTYTILLAGVTSGDHLTLGSVGGDLEIIGFSMACFLEGTRIATPSGDMAVETLREGALVLTASASAKPIRWIGHRRVTTADALDPLLHAPILIRKDAIAAGKPRRDLWVTPDHCLYVQGKLIPAKLLVNGGTIQQVPREAYTYYHIELDDHALLLAEGLEAESYLEVAGARRRFDNNPVTDLRPDLSITERTEQMYARHGCHPIALDAEAVQPVWQALADRADAASEINLPCWTSEPDLHVRIAGMRVPPIAAADGTYVFMLPFAAEEIAIISRAGCPWDRRPWVDDRRQLGVAINRVAYVTERGSQDLPLDGAELAAGWHGVEGAPGEHFRWTNGAARLRLPLQTGCIILAVAANAEYRVEPEPIQDMQRIDLGSVANRRQVAV